VADDRHSHRSTRSLTLPIEHLGDVMKSPNPQPSFVMLCVAVPVLLGVSFVGLRGNDRAAALGACALAGAVLPLVRTRPKGAVGLLPIPDSAGDHDGVFWEAEVLSLPGEPITFRVTGHSGNSEETFGRAADEWLAGPKFPPGHIAAEDRERVLKAYQVGNPTRSRNFETRIPRAQCAGAAPMH
jgi:hypothetical protein